ncbi:MAG: symmetrical bis(5'-nucleosyl)-tetraphosphatase [Neisseria sp.]|nr:symmetrical bis(5'-nucleosyl)-tetraphosphatase [Neisseria sp.]
MAHYAIGDLQGCFYELQNLLKKIDFNHGRDTLWLTGDIVNRGSHSLECLEFCMRHESSVQTVLGNHDLHLLALMYGLGKHKRSDTLLPILNHPNMPKMRDWLRQQPLLIESEQHVLVHAGLLPQWSIDLANKLAGEVEETLQSAKVEHFFATMYGNKPIAWSHMLTGEERLRLITNVFTRMRAITLNNELDYDFKKTLPEMPEHLQPWFAAENRQNLDKTIVFGHWSALGLHQNHQVIGLDTGALWGGELTAINLDTQEISQTPSLKGLDWEKLS